MTPDFSSKVTKAITSYGETCGGRPILDNGEFIAVALSSNGSGVDILRFDNDGNISKTIPVSFEDLEPLVNAVAKKVAKMGELDWSCFCASKKQAAAMIWLELYA